MSRLALLIALGLAQPLVAEEVTIFAAASLQTALDRIAADHEAATGDQVTAVYGGSATLAKQIAAGAPVDLFISASSDWMDDLDGKGLLAKGSRVDLLGNRLVLIAPGTAAAAATPMSSDFDLPGALGGGKLAMALVDSVPAGVYGKQALTALGLWEVAEPMVVQADNVRAALTLVARGEAALGITYASDAVAEPAVHVAATFPATSHDPITYPLAVLAGAAHPQAAARLAAALQAAPAQAIFAANGFTPPPVK